MREDREWVRMNESCLKNGARMTAVGGVLGAFISSFEAFYHPVSSSALHAAGRATTMYILPFAFGGALYGSITCLMDDIRGKDKPVSNSFIGGTTAGLLVATKSFRPATCFISALTVGAIAAALRAGATGALLIDQKEQFEHTSKTLYLKDISYLRPSQ